MELAIPDRYKPGISKIASLPERAVESLQAALRSAPAAVTARALAETIAPRVPEIDGLALKGIVAALTSLYRARETSGIELANFVNDVWNAAAAEDFSEWELSRSQREVFQHHLNKLLQENSLDVAEAKGKELQAEFERVFSDARILTDLRPVFAGDLSGLPQDPKAVVIVHTLKLGYYVGEQRQRGEIYLALDAEDIKNLKGILERALAKAERLKTLQPNLELNILEL